MLEYAGKGKRTSNLYDDNSVLAKGKKLFSNMFTEVQNVLLQHKPLMTTIIDSAVKGKLPPDQYPSTVGFDFRDKYANVIVFMVGGTTYEEAKEMATIYNSQEDRVILGGTYIHNSKSFIAEISQIKEMGRANKNGVNAFEMENLK